MTKKKWIQITASGAGSESRLYALNDEGEIYFITPDKAWQKCPNVLEESDDK